MKPGFTEVQAALPEVKPGFFEVQAALPEVKPDFFEVQAALPEEKPGLIEVQATLHEGPPGLIEVQATSPEVKAAFTEVMPDDPAATGAREEGPPGVLLDAAGATPKSSWMVTAAPRTPELPRANRVISIPRFELGDRLTAEQVDFLETYGFIRFKSFVSRSRAKELYGAVLEVNDALVAKGVSQLNGVPLILGARADGTRYVQRIPFASLQHPALHEFLQDPRLRAIVDMGGPGYRVGEDERDGMVVNRFRNEPGAKYKRLGWHTDSLRDVFYLEKPRRYLNVGFYFTDSPLEVGGLRVLPCTHNQPISSMLLHKIHFVDDKPDPNELAIVAEAGDLTIHDGRMWHRTALATRQGDASERCVSYLPFMDGPVKRKNDKSSTPFYFHLKGLVGY